MTALTVVAAIAIGAALASIAQHFGL